MAPESTNSTTTRQEAHEYADIMPMMSDREYKALCDDIRDVGLVEPILLFEGKILDGRNRYKACLELGIEAKAAEFKGSRDEALSRVVSANLQRRHLKPSQRAALGVRLIPLVREDVHKARREKLSDIAKGRAKKVWQESEGDKGGKKGAKVPTPDEAAKIRVRKIVADMLGIADRLVGDAQTLAKKDKVAFGKVQRGEMSLNRAIGPRRKKRSANVPAAAEPDAQPEVREPKSKRMSRAQRFDRALGLVSNAKDEAEELKSELESWLGNMPESTQSGSKAEELQEAIDALDQFIGQLDEAGGTEVSFPGMFG